MKTSTRNRAVVAGSIVAATAVLAALAIRTRARNLRNFEWDVARRRPLGKTGIVRGAEPVYLTGSATHAVLIIHGFGDTPQSVQPVATALNAAGWTTYSMLLPGHARPLRQYARARSIEWLSAVRATYQALRARHEVVVVCGISMGAALAAILAAETQEIPAVALLAPYLVMPRDTQIKTALANLVELIYPYHTNSGGDQSIRDPDARGRTLGMGVVTANLLQELRWVAMRAQRALPLVKARALYLQSREDNRLSARDAREQFARLGSTVKEQRWLTGCGHIITVDYCKDEVARQVVEWFAGELRG